MPRCAPATFSLDYTVFMGLGRRRFGALSCHPAPTAIRKEGKREAAVQLLPGDLATGAPRLSETVGAGKIVIWPLLP
jgi:hypothetical protein